MILYEVLWNNDECYDRDLTISLIFTTLKKAKEYYNKKHIASGYGKETLTIYSFEPDIEHQKRTKIESKILDNPTPDIEEEEWEPDMDDFGTCDVADTY